MNLDPKTWISIIVLIVGLSLMAAMYLMEKYPAQDLRPKLIPTTFFLLVGLLLALASGVHLIQLLGPRAPLN